MSDEPDSRPGNPVFRRENLLLICASVAHFALMSRIGHLNDDMRDLMIARETSWLRVFTLDGVPVPFHLALLKASDALFPGHGFGTVRIICGLLHAFNAFLVRAFLRRRLPDRTALLLALLFLFYRPGFEAVAWVGAAPKELLLAAFVLLMCLAWDRRDLRTGCRWGTVVFGGLAVLAKPNGVTAIALLLHIAAAENGRRAAAWKRDGPALVAALFLMTALFAHAFLNPGYYGGHATLEYLKEPASLATQIFQMTGAQFFPVVPAPQSFNRIQETAGLLVLPVLLAATAYDFRVAGFALLWIMALVLPPIISTGIYGSRYVYAAAPAVLLLLGRAFGKTGDTSRRLATVLALLWMAANASLWVSDYRLFYAMGRLGTGIGETLTAHRNQLERAGGIDWAYDRFVTPPIPGIESNHMSYLFGRDWPVHPQLNGKCPPGRQYPCIRTPATYTELLDCTYHNGPCIQWRDSEGGGTGP